MLGRDVSMPNAAGPADLSSEERDDARELAQRLLDRIIDPKDPSAAAERLLARAILRYVPAGVPQAMPHLVAAADDRTTRAGVLGVMEPILGETSDGVCEASDDGSTRPAPNLDLTAIYDPAIHGDPTRR